MGLSLAEQLRQPHPQPRSNRLVRWLLMGIVELGVVAGIAYWVARSGVEQLARAEKAVHDSEKALLAAIHGSVKFAYAVAAAAPEGHAELLTRAEAVDRDQPIEERLRAVESLDREVAYVLANPPPRFEMPWRRMRSSLPGMAQSRATDKLNLTLARGRWREAGQSYAAWLAIRLKMAPPPPVDLAPR
jgi:hypothetical protein